MTTTDTTTTETTTRTYTTRGSVRGECGHAHRTYRAAARCAERDQRLCAAAGGYSDRGVFRDGGEIAPEVHEAYADLVAGGGADNDLIDRTLEALA